MKESLLACYVLLTILFASIQINVEGSRDGELVEPLMNDDKVVMEPALSTDQWLLYQIYEDDTTCDYAVKQLRGYHIDDCQTDMTFFSLLFVNNAITKTDEFSYRISVDNSTDSKQLLFLLFQGNTLCSGEISEILTLTSSQNTQTDDLSFPDPTPVIRTIDKPTMTITTNRKPATATTASTTDWTVSLYLNECQGRVDGSNQGARSLLLYTGTYGNSTLLSKFSSKYIIEEL